MDYLPMFPETLEAISVYDDKSDRCDLYEAMLRYAFDGVEPQFPPGDGKRFAWVLLRQRVDASARKCAEGRANGAKGGRPSKKRGFSRRNPGFQPKTKKKKSLSLKKKKMLRERKISAH